MTPGIVDRTQSVAKERSVSKCQGLSWTFFEDGPQDQIVLWKMSVLALDFTSSSSVKSKIVR